MNNEAERLNVRGLLGVSDFCISIEGNKKSVGEFIEFGGLSGRERERHWQLSPVPQATQ
jgi:hypothetical protein